MDGAPTARSRKAWAFGVVAAAALMPWAARAFVGRGTEGVQEEPPPTAQALPTEIDTTTSLEQVAAKLDDCAAVPDADAARCSGVIYVWTPRMPLSRMGIAEISEAARHMGLTLDVVRAESLYPASASEHATALAATLVAAGSSLHAPALLLHRRGRIDPTAILGYKSADAYASLIESRLAEAPANASPSDLPVVTEALAANVARPAPSAATPTTAAVVSAAAVSAAAPALEWKDFPIPGQPGAYFRWVPGRNAVAYEAAGQILLLDLANGERRVGPGFVDFVPTPDGRFFVTPGRDREMEFYDANEVFTAASAGRGRSVPPIYTDPRMRDQYPSIGVLSTATRGGETRTVYRVLTSWFEQVVFRDYEVVSTNGRHTFRPLQGPVVACGSLEFSTPIMAQDGREVAGRDEATGTTKVFRLADDGGCQQVIDLKLPTGKVAWDADGRRLAFAIPEGVLPRGAALPGLEGDDRNPAGVFVYDRRDASLERVEGSLDARRLSFPEFVGKDQLLFLLPRDAGGGSSRFRLVCCLR